MEADFFDGCCAEVVEGYRFVPTGKTWTREDGTVFHGEMVAPHKPYSDLYRIQHEYEFKQLEDMKNALGVLGVDV